MMRGDEVVSPLLQEELDGRVADAGGDIEAVKLELEYELKTLESAATESGQPQMGRRDAALLLAEIQYLTQLQESAESASHAAHVGLMARMRHAVGL